MPTGPYGLPHWGQATGPPASRGYDVHPVAYPATPSALRADEAEAPPTPGEVAQAVYAALCQAAACCTVLAEPLPTAHPGFRTRVEDLEGRAVIVVAGTDTAAPLALAANIFAASVGLAAATIGPVTLASLVIPKGKAGVLRAWDVAVMNGDPTSVEVAVMSGSDRTRPFGPPPLAGVRRPDDLSSWGILQENDEVLLRAQTVAGAVSPYLVHGRMSIWTWSVTGGRGDSLEALLNKAGRMNKSPRDCPPAWSGR